MKGAPAIAGLGFSEIGKLYGRDAGDLAVDAVKSAVTDAALRLDDIDGLIVSYGIAPSAMNVAFMLGLRDLRLNVNMSSAGATAIAAIHYASMAVMSGAARRVVYVHADAPLRHANERESAAYSAAAHARASLGFRSIMSTIGLSGMNPLYALATRRHMERYGTTSEQLGSVAMAQRDWAADNPLARFRQPITVDDHQASRIIADPLHLLDCCVVTNGAIAFVVTSSEEAQDLAQPAVNIWGWAQSHPNYRMERGSEFGLRSGAAISGPAALAMAGLGTHDVSQAQIYDCYTFTVLLTLEDYGFCAKGEGGEFVASGALGRNGSLPTNTGGGQLSGYYLWGATPLSEAVIQARGHGGGRQAANDVVLVSGNGGALDYHATLVVSPHPAGDRS